VFNKDSYVSSANAGTNYGTAVTLQVGYDNTGGKAVNTLAAFAAVDFSELNPDLTVDNITAAICKMYCWSKTGTPANRWSRNTSDWIESGLNSITWDVKPGQSTPNSDTVESTAGSWTTWNILDMIKDAITNRSYIWNASCWTQTYTANVENANEFSSREYTTDTSLRPYIEIDYTAGGVTFTAKIMMF
jgi:hypothetical protein